MHVSHTNTKNRYLKSSKTKLAYWVGAGVAPGGFVISHCIYLKSKIFKNYQRKT